jgi:hypothetical protein
MLWVLDCVVSKALAYEVLPWCCDEASFQALAIGLPHIRFEAEEGLQSFGLQC